MKIKIEMERKSGKELSVEEEIQLLQDEMRRLREVNYDPKKIVNESGLEEYLAKGCADSATIRKDPVRKL